MALQHIPPIQCLLTFEAVARLRHAGRAADELCVTPSAVSHRIRQLESHVGLKLFGRGDFSLTADGAAYLVNVRAGLAALQAVPNGDASPRATRLRLAVTPTFSRQFLMPRLELFRNIYPDVDLVLQVSIPLLDVTAEQADLEVRYGPGAYADCESRLLLEETVVPACSPSYLNEFGPFNGFRTDAEIANARLIRSPLEPWSTWFASCGLDHPEPQLGSQFNDLGLVYDAAASGFGVALVRQKLGAQWLESGRLVPLSDRPVPSPHRHYVCWQPGTLDRWECEAFAEWLVETLS
ncbi:LysR substrate-binding domain-containing protein [Variovorax saccharolyticus]|uniref:LysR substrate-binding domain-containing protein n=1 Tax=Variovorax saccharolyticus TaxID=3053516 RepID=UPI0025766A26|nr:MULTISPECIES: LysR substrate-binding domain-containing protein [unclassified Variovorax]MDM0017114.1 LysR substrate-binding domain-containing protein [Variovorax sp. J22R187]MDM0029352.1 LysR substrate-binding domain-containing protein [Variovorax sp. J31P216]